MKATILNPLNSLMCRLCEQCADLLAQNAKCNCYDKIRNWFSDTVVLYGLTVSNGYNTYLKQALDEFETHIRLECGKRKHETCCNNIYTLMSDMIALLEQ